MTVFEFGGILIGVFLTLGIYSYIWRDNALYRLAIHVLVGVSTAYAMVIAARDIIWPVFQQLAALPSNPSLSVALWVVPIFFAFILLFKLFPRLSWLGNSSIAVLVGIGAAVALTGAIAGTLWPQVTSVLPQDSNGNVATALLTGFLTICTLLYFQFTSGHLGLEGQIEQPWWQKYLGGYVGKGVITITFGVLFAGVLSTSLVLLSYRLDLLIDVLLNDVFQLFQ